MENQTIFQFFHWYYPGDGSLWRHCNEQASHLSSLGFTHVWLPPAYKSAGGGMDTGYAVYDLFDLGEFDQKGSIRTKYGTKKEYLDCINSLHANNLKVIADAVLNHRMGGDETEMIPVKEVDVNDRNHIKDEEVQLEWFTKYNFPGRKGKYSTFVWDWHSFTGVSTGDNGDLKIWSIQNEYGHDWEEMIDDENGNFDYLMGADVEFRNPHVTRELKKWAKWYIKTTNVDGFRLDAVKHINHNFFRQWIPYIKKTFNKDFIFIAEYWRHDWDILDRWGKALDWECQLFDVPLHYNFHRASKENENYDLRQIFDFTLLQNVPHRTITFVDNRDSQPFQQLESYIDGWFKPSAYALILLRFDGIPCVFYPEVYGASYKEWHGENEIEINLEAFPTVQKMITARKYLNFGSQQDYFNEPNLIGWVRKGEKEKQFSGFAVVISNKDNGGIEMELGEEFAGKTFVDLTGGIEDKLQLNEQGAAMFPVNARSVSIWVNEESLIYFH